MEKDFRFTLKGKKYTFESFVNAYGMPEDMAEVAVSEYLRTGLATEDMDPNTVRAKKLQDDMDTIFATDNNGQQVKPYYLLEPPFNKDTEKMWGDHHSSFFYPFDVCYYKEKHAQIVHNKNFYAVYSLV